MKEYHIISIIVFLLCVIGIILTIINWFTGFINTKIMTNGGTVICLMGFSIGMISTIRLEKKE